jgi:hypothetical protein
MVESIFGMYKNAFPVIFDDVVSKTVSEVYLKYTLDSVSNRYLLEVKLL